MTTISLPSGLVLNTTNTPNLITGPFMTPVSIALVNPTGTTSASVMMGFGAQGTPSTFKPLVTGRVRICFTGRLKSDTAADGIGFIGKWGTVAGGIPANAAAATGTTFGTVAGGANPVNAANAFQAFTCEGVVSLTPGTAYWADLALGAITGGTASITNVYVSIVEYY